eukprot:CAMPEP_0203738676 /NCGR_PEP_ID=MMETSP0092-20131115/43421_1 /ASSEMBLY_ACC=CAM_ASM_001090 /TAXON_ID=426623 /ORGANISM="Chaetoceros affinis, Strain CCMP159" /LENGTH=92 /DNA_ID=CAMNT_0050624451 /DNA_START=74 /DNA_END=352 /DNA_ORIENTATION=+
MFKPVWAAPNPSAVELPAMAHPNRSGVPSLIPTTSIKKFWSGRYAASVPTKKPVAPPIATESEASVLLFSYVGSSTYSRIEGKTVRPILKPA